MARPMSRSRGADPVFDALTIGAAGQKIRKIKTGDVTVDPASINAATTGETDVTITGVKAGDMVFFLPPATLDAGIVVSAPSRVSADDTVKLRLGNVTVGAINVASATWKYIWVKFVA